MRSDKFVSKKAENLYSNLSSQIDRVHRHNNMGSYKSRERNKNSMQRFAVHLSNNYGLQSLKNVSNKHIKSYVEEMQGKYAPSTIKCELSGIRMYLDLIGNKNKIVKNDALNLERRNNMKDRKWKEKEYEAFRNLCKESGRERDYIVSTIARNTGMRIHEIYRVSKLDARKSLEKMEFSVKGKGGKCRTIYINDEVKSIFEKRLKEMEEENNKSDKLFVNEDEKTHLCIKSSQNFLNRNRDKFEERNSENSETHITYHGLRHNYANEKYNEYIENGLSSREAEFLVSELLGHNRSEITRRYTC